MKLALCTNCIGKLFMSNNVNHHFAYSDKKFDAFFLSIFKCNFEMVYRSL